MSLIRQIAALLAGVIVLALAGGVTLNVVAARETLQTQLRLKNADNAAALALALSQHKGDATTIDLLVAAQFDTGHYRRILLTDPQGQVRAERIGPGPVGDAPAWFAGLLPIVSTPGVAQVSDGWRPIGRLEVVSHTAYAHDALWRGALQAAAWMALVGLLAGTAAALGVRRVRGPLAAMVGQAQALQDGRFVHLAEPRSPELKALVRAMNSMVERLRALFDAQARQVDELRRQAERDAATGCLSRRQLVVRLDAALGGERAHGGGGLVLVRVADLEAINRRMGRLAADAHLRTVADALMAFEARVPGCLAGRLNGADFVLYLPAAGVAEETGATLAEGLRVAIGAMDGQVALHVGSADLDGLADAGSALAAVDAALAEAEAQAPFTAQHRPASAGAASARPEADWRERIESALAGEAAQLAAYPVVGRDGALLHLECPLRLQLEPGGPNEPAAVWLPHALRSRLSARIDLRAAELALHALANDPRPRGVNVALESLATPGFVAEMRLRLLAAPQAARALWLELPERALRQCPELLADAARQWRETGAAVGIEHAGGETAALGGLYALGLAYVKVDRRHVDGVAHDAAVRQFASSLVTLLRGLGLLVIAEGVRDAADLAVLWELGFDAATGPVVADR